VQLEEEMESRAKDTKKKKTKVESKTNSEPSVIKSLLFNEEM
jgi:hypothetical protein